MAFSRALLVLGLAFTFLAGSATAQAVKGAKKGKKAHAVHGVVVKVDKEKVNGTITIRVHHKKNAEAAVAEEEKTFRITDLTKFEKVIVKGKGKENRETKPASFADIQLGQHVAIVTAGNSGDARAVAIVHRQKNKAKAQ
jgi:hypothetical protein